MSVCQTCGVDGEGYAAEVKRLQEALRWSCQMCQQDNGFSKYAKNMNCHECKIEKALNQQVSTGGVAK